MDVIIRRLLPVHTPLLQTVLLIPKKETLEMYQCRKSRVMLDGPFEVEGQAEGPFGGD